MNHEKARFEGEAQSAAGSRGNQMNLGDPSAGLRRWLGPVFLTCWCRPGCTLDRRTAQAHRLDLDADDLLGLKPGEDRSSTPALAQRVTRM